MLKPNVGLNNNFIVAPLKELLKSAYQCKVCMSKENRIKSAQGDEINKRQRCVFKCLSVDLYTLFRVGDH